MRGAWRADQAEDAVGPYSPVPRLLATRIFGPRSSASTKYTLGGRWSGRQFSARRSQPNSGRGDAVRSSEMAARAMDMVRRHEQRGRRGGRQDGK